MFVHTTRTAVLQGVPATDPNGEFVRPASAFRNWITADGSPSPTGRGRSPAGRRLPPAVLSRQGYLRLIELLDDPLCAKVLHHLEQRTITDSIVSILYEAPAVLRPVLAELLRVIESTEKLDHLQDGLRWLITRGAAESFDTLVTDLAVHVQPGQFVARLKKLVSELPLPQTLPPKKIGKARRVDATADICALAKRSRIASQLFRDRSMLGHARSTFGTTRLNLPCV